MYRQKERVKNCGAEEMVLVGVGGADGWRGGAFVGQQNNGACWMVVLVHGGFCGANSARYTFTDRFAMYTYHI